MPSEPTDRQGPRALGRPPRALIIGSLLVGGLVGMTSQYSPSTAPQPDAVVASLAYSEHDAVEFMAWPLPNGAQPPPERTVVTRPMATHALGRRAMCERIAGKLSSVGLDECLGMRMAASDGRSVLGSPILVREYPPLAQRTPQARVLLVGGIHGDEYSSVSVVFKWMGILNDHHSGLFHWAVVPLLNPDGLLRDQAQRMNENGVDLNRNFPTPNWHHQSEHYWVHRTKRNPRRYPGPDPLSEPESQWLAQMIQRFQPDAIVSVHAPYGVLDFDGPSQAPKRLGHLYLNLLGTYPGSLGNYAGVQKQIPVVTIELPHAGIMPTKAQISDIWVDLVKWLRRNIGQRTIQVRNEAQAEPS